MGTIKDRNSKDLIEANKIKKRWKEYTEEQYKKDLNDLDNHDGAVSHSEPDILEYEVNWALESSIGNKILVKVMEFQQLFKILKDDVIKVLHSISQQIWKTQQWPQDWKRSILILIPKKCSTKECSKHWTIALMFISC